MPYVRPAQTAARGEGPLVSVDENRHGKILAGEPRPASDVEAAADRRAFGRLIDATRQRSIFLPRRERRRGGGGSLRHSSPRPRGGLPAGERHGDTEGQDRQDGEPEEGEPAADWGGGSRRAGAPGYGFAR